MTRRLAGWVTAFVVETGTLREQRVGHCYATILPALRRPMA